MRLLRFFLILLISVALPFTNVAAAAMVHCAQEAAMMQAAATGMHAHHHAAQAQQDTGQHHAHPASGKAEKSSDGCSQCSYCQSCASAFFPAADNRMPSFSASDIKPDLLAVPAPAAHRDPLFRPPRLAFA